MKFIGDVGEVRNSEEFVFVIKKLNTLHLTPPYSFTQLSGGA